MPFRKINGKDLFYVWRPSPSERDKPEITLVFIHGLGSSSSFFMTVIPQLCASGVSCLALDTAGSGLSEHSGDQSIEEISKDVQSLLSILEIQSTKVIVIGHSMGSLVVSELASRGEFAGAVLIGPINPSTRLTNVFTERIKTVEKEGLESLAETIPEAATGSEAIATHRAFIRALILSQNPSGYSSLCRTIANANTPHYGGISCPLLVITGEDDRTAIVEDAHAILDSLVAAKSKRLEQLPGVGHWHCVEAADRVGSLIEVFAREVQIP